MKIFKHFYFFGTIVFFLFSCGSDDPETDDIHSNDNKKTDNLVGFYEDGLNLKSTQINLPESIENEAVMPLVNSIIAFIELQTVNLNPNNQTNVISINDKISFPGDILNPTEEGQKCFSGNEIFSEKITWNAGQLSYVLNVGQNDVSTFWNTKYLITDSDETFTVNVLAFESKNKFEGCMTLVENEIVQGNFTWNEENKTQRCVYTLFDNNDISGQFVLQTNPDKSGFITIEGESIFRWDANGKTINSNAL